MTSLPASDVLPARRLVCAGCGTAFGCDSSGQCWCMEEAFALPMPTAGGDCLCPACLRKMAVGDQRAAGGPKQRRDIRDLPDR